MYSLSVHAHFNQKKLQINCDLVWQSSIISWLSTRGWQCSSEKMNKTTYIHFSTFTKDFFPLGGQNVTTSQLHHPFSFPTSNHGQFSMEREEDSPAAMLSTRGEARERPRKPFLHRTWALILASPGKASDEMYQRLVCFGFCFKSVNGILHHIWLNPVI